MDTRFVSSLTEILSNRFHRQAIAFQWIFAFVILGVLFSISAVVAIASWSGHELNFGQNKKPQTDAERAPLLEENN